MKIARCARCGGCYFRRLPRSAYKIADIWHVRYRRLNSRAFAKCARSRDFLPFPLRVANKIFYRLAILSHDSSKWRACELFLSLTQHLGFTKYDLKTPWNHQNRTVSFTRSHVNAERCISVKQGDQCEKG